jgi:hypothetical protein
MRCWPRASAWQGVVGAIAGSGEERARPTKRNRRAPGWTAWTWSLNINGYHVGRGAAPTAVRPEGLSPIHPATGYARQSALSSNHIISSHIHTCIITKVCISRATNKRVPSKNLPVDRWRKIALRICPGSALQSNRQPEAVS